MRKLIVLGVAGCIAASAVASMVMAADGLNKPVKPVSKDHPLDEIWSGRKWASASTSAMQDDDFANPAGPWLETGESNWSKVDGEAGKSCASCHNDAAQSMKGVATRYPAIDKASNKLMALEARINNCRTKNMKAKPYKWESGDMLGMMIFVKSHSRGLPMSVKVDGNYKKYFEQGKAFYYQRRGQLDMACSHCHEVNFGNQIRAEVLSQGQSNGFPTYRLKWQKPGSLHRRFKGCNEQVRSKAFKRGSPEYTSLELYLAWRGQGLPVETPAVRR